MIDTLGCSSSVLVPLHFLSGCPPRFKQIRISLIFSIFSFKISPPLRRSFHEPGNQKCHDSIKLISISVGQSCKSLSSRFTSRRFSLFDSLTKLLWYDLFSFSSCFVRQNQEQGGEFFSTRPFRVSRPFSFSFVYQRMRKPTFWFYLIVQPLPKVKDLYLSR